VQLGITQPNGVPIALFTTGEAHWLGVQISGEAEQSRVLLRNVRSCRIGFELVRDWRVRR
jgi:hypothetical protein